MNRNAVETIKQKLSIESVVGSYVKLEKAGKNFRARCPFHNEKTASFTVTPDKGIFYCYGCHKGGDIFNFVQDIEGVEFYDALKILAEKAGVELGDYKNEKPNRAAILREIMEHATKFYEVGLRTNKNVVEYLLSRGLSKETMVKWRIGFSPKNWSDLYDYLRNKKYSDEDILATGVCLAGQRGLYDRFRERIMFPISDGQGRVVAFTGRILPGTEEASRPVGKYINSPETELYHKSSILFGFDKAKSAIHSQNFAIIVEGQMDCIMSHQAGVENIVALSGTACTEEQMKQILRFTTNISVALDDDGPGLVAAQKTAMVAYALDMNVSAIDIPNGKDPADTVKEDPELWKKAIEQRKDFITFRLLKMHEKNQEKDKVQIAKKELFPILSHISSPIVLDDKMKEIAKFFNQSSVEPVRKEFDEFLKKKESNFTQKNTPPTIKKEIITKDVVKESMLGILLSFQSGVIFDQLKVLFEKIVGPLAPYFSNLPEALRAKYVSETEQVLGNMFENSENYEKAFHRFLIRYQLLLVEEEKDMLDHKLATDPDNAEIMARIHTILKDRDHLIHQLHNQ